MKLEVSGMAYILLRVVLISSGIGNYYPFYSVIRWQIKYYKFERKLYTSKTYPQGIA